MLALGTKHGVSIGTFSCVLPIATNRNQVSTHLVSLGVVSMFYISMSVLTPMLLATLVATVQEVLCQ